MWTLFFGRFFLFKFAHSLLPTSIEHAVELQQCKFNYTFRRICLYRIEYLLIKKILKDFLILCKKGFFIWLFKSGNKIGYYCVFDDDSLTRSRIFSVAVFSASRGTLSLADGKLSTDSCWLLFVNGVQTPWILGLWVFCFFNNRTKVSPFRVRMNSSQRTNWSLECSLKFSVCVDPFTSNFEIN